MVPEAAAPIYIAPFALTESASLWDNLPTAIGSDKPLTMEDIGQNYGWILYRTQLADAADTGALTIHDFAHVYFNRQLEPGFNFDRRLRTTDTSEDIASKAAGSPVQVDILVGNEGRINYSHQLLSDRKGIVAVSQPAEDAPANHWSIYSLPMDDVSPVRFGKPDCSGPCFYRGTFNVDATGDTFLDASHLVKGQMWVNGHALGRFWNIGPQKTLYVPGPWMKKGANQVVVFDVDGKPGATLEGLTKPNLGE